MLTKNGLNKSTTTKIIELTSVIDNAKKELEKIKNDLFKEMKNKNIDKIDNDLLLINLIGETFRNDIDKIKLKEKYQKAYNECQKITSVKEHLSIKVK